MRWRAMRARRTGRCRRSSAIIRTRRKRKRRRTFGFEETMPARPEPPARLRFRVQIRRLRLRGRSRFLSVVARLRWSPTGAPPQESVLRVHRWLVGREELAAAPAPPLSVLETFSPCHCHPGQSDL